MSHTHWRLSGAPSWLPAAPWALEVETQLECGPGLLGGLGAPHPAALPEHGRAWTVGSLLRSRIGPPWSQRASGPTPPTSGVKKSVSALAWSPRASRAGHPRQALASSPRICHSVHGAPASASSPALGWGGAGPVPAPTARKVPASQHPGRGEVTCHRHSGDVRTLTTGGWAFEPVL